eukprot:2399196-Prymnesium_polylepis.1
MGRRVTSRAVRKINSANSARARLFRLFTGRATPFQTGTNRPMSWPFMLDEGLLHSRSPSITVRECCQARTR